MSVTAVPTVTGSGQSALVLKEDRGQSKGRSAMENNIEAALMICEIVSTSLGPHGMDKLIVESDYEGRRTTVTNDGATMLDKMQIQHPAGRILVDVSKATDSGVGDGTTSAVVIAGALLERANELLKKGLNPLVVVAGFREAARKANEILESLAERIDPTDRAVLESVARTSMQSKIIEENSSRIASIVVDAALAVAVKRENGKFRVDVKNIKVDKKQGSSIAETELVRGIVIDQSVAHPGMPRRVENARIALVNMPFEMEEATTKSMITISRASQLTQFLNKENAKLKSMVDKLVSVGANVLLCQKEIDEMALHYLAMSGVMAVKKSLEFDGPNISRATGARVVGHLDDLTSEDLGYADVVEEKLVGTDKMLYIRGTKDPKAISILVRGANSKVVDEARRSINDAIMVVRDLIQEPAFVVGGGAVEAEVACQLARWVTELEGREQLAAEKYAEALEQIPRVLALNAGLDPINVLAELRAKHAEGGEGRSYGIPLTGKKIRNLRAEGVLEPLAVKAQILKSATEAVCMILRVDNVITVMIPKPDDSVEKAVAKTKREEGLPGPPPSALAQRV